MSVSEQKQLQVVRGACPHDCPDTCAMLVTVQDGRATRVQGDPKHPYTRGALCAKVVRYPERVYSPNRVLHPLRRAGQKGEGRFERISWDDAIALVAERLKSIAASPDGPQAILPYSYMGTQGLIQGSSMDRRFFHRLGASLLERNICAEAGIQGYLRTMGSLDSADPEDVAHSRLVVAWGVNILTTNQHLWPFVRQARSNGARLITVDPYRTRTAAQSDQHIQIAPGTDAALALGMMHVILSEGLEDREYLSRHAEGLDQLRMRAGEWRPKRAADVTGLAEDEIVRFAREYATTRPAMIRLLLGLQRHAGGAMAVRTVACLPALVGAWRDKGGGILFITAGKFGLNWSAVQREDLAQPETRSVNMTTLGHALTDPTMSPPIRALVVYGSNPAVIAPDSQRVLDGLRREDLFTVVAEQFLTDTAHYADVVFPVTTQLEHWDLMWSWGHHYLTLNQPSIASLGEARPTTELFRLLAASMGFDEPAFTDSDQALIRQALDSNEPSLSGISFERLLRDGWAKLNLGADYRPFAEGGFFGSSEGKVALYSAQMAREGLDPLPSYTPPCESRDADPVRAARYPLRLLSIKSHHFLNSTFANVASLARDAGPRFVEINPADAAARGITEGREVRVYNDRGSFGAVARVTDRVRTGVLMSPFGWWRGGEDGTAVNSTTSQALTDLGHGPTFHDNGVEISPISS